MTPGVHGVGGDRQGEALLDVLHEPSLLPIGVLRAAQRDQDVVGLELRDRVRDDGQDAAPSGRAAGVRADRVHVAEHRVQPLVGDMPHPIDLIGEPGKPAGQAWA